MPDIHDESKHPLHYGNMAWTPHGDMVMPVVGHDGIPWKEIIHPKPAPLEFHISGPNSSVSDFLKKWSEALMNDPHKEMIVPSTDLFLVRTAVRFVIKARRKKGGSVRQRKHKFQVARHQATVVVSTKKFTNVVPGNIQIKER